MSNGKIKNCYISAPADVDLGPLRRSLSQRGISVSSPESQLLSSDAIGEFNSFLNGVDLVIGVLSKSRRSDWIVFELGVAWAAGRKILLVIPPGTSLAPPVSLRGLLTVRATASNSNAIGFALDQLQSAPEVVTSNPQVAKEVVPGAAVVASAEAAQRAIATGDSSGLEKAIGDALQDAQLDGFVKELEGRSKRVDFAVWVDAFANTVGNPLIIEVKLRIPSVESMRDVAYSLSKSVTAVDARFGLLIYGEGPKRGLSALPFNVLSLSVTDFFNELRTQSFAALVTQLRNRRMHGIEG